MKKPIRREHLFLYIGLISLVGMSYFHDPYRMLCYSVFFASVALLYIIKNKYVAYGASLVLMLAYSVYMASYAMFMIPVYLLIIFYRDIIKKINAENGKKNRKGYVGHPGLHFLFLLGLVEVIYATVRYFNNDYYADYGSVDVFPVISVALIVIFLVGVFSKKLKKEVRQIFKVSNKNYITLNMVNFVGVFLFFSSVFLNFAAYQDFHVNSGIACFPWTVWLCVLVYEKNPLTEAMLKLIEEEIRKVSERRINEK